MKTSKLASTTAALALVALLGTAGIASSAPAEVPAPPVAGQMGPHMGPHMNMTTEQLNALQDIHKEFGPKMQPLFQQKYGKQAEINALLYQGVKADDPRIVALQKDVKDVDGKLYQLDAAMRKQMQDKGVEVRQDPSEGFSLIGLLISWLPVLLIVGVFIWFMRQMQSGGGGRGAMSFGRSRAKLQG